MLLTRTREPAVVEEGEAAVAAMVDGLALNAVVTKLASTELDTSRPQLEGRSMVEV